MKIKGIYTGELRVPLITPFKTALRTVEQAQTILVAVVLESGETGFGEAPPTAVITGDTKESIVSAVENFIGPQLIGKSIEDFDDLMKTLHSAMVHNTSAKAAVDMALYDLKAKRAGISLVQALGGKSRRLQTDCTISVNTPDEMLRDAQLAEEKGFEILKIKIGKDAEEDFKRLQRLSQGLKSSTIVRLDANQGWRPDEAVSVINRITRLPLNIDLIEQPVHALDFEGMRFVKDRIDIPLLADESVFGPEDALRIIQMGAADLINIKLMKSGGIHRALQINALAEQHGIPCMVGCMLETAIGVGAAAHFAAACDNIQRADLDGPTLCSDTPIIGGTSFTGQWIELNDTPGLGIQQIKDAFIYRPLFCELLTSTPR